MVLLTLSFRGSAVFECDADLRVVISDAFEKDMQHDVQERRRIVMAFDE